MPPELAIRAPWRSSLAALPGEWRRPLACLALAWVALVALTAADWAAMAHQWWDVSTYNHVLLVIPILAWLVRLRAPVLATLQPRAWWPGLVVVAGALLLWLLGTVSSFDSASQLGAVVMLQGAVLALLGPRIVGALAFPLAYMLFLVPFGDELVPMLQLVTARLTIMLTHWSGIPAVIDGVFIDTPIGLFEVAEACSGVKFLIAMVALGALVANLCFESWRRRAAFMAVAIALPILANGVRAWGTIYIAQSRGLAFAAGFDHIFYGWIFFAIVMVALLGLSWRFFDRAPDDMPQVPRWPVLDRWERRSSDPRRLLAALAGMVLATAAWGGASRSLAAELPAKVDLPVVSGWERVGYAPQVWWEPRASGADRRLLGRYRDAQGRQVDVFLALYASQGDGHEAGAAGEGALVPATAWRWLRPAPAPSGGEGEWLQAEGHVRRYAVTWYRSGDLLTGDRKWLKLRTMADRMTMQAQPVAMLIVSAEEAPGSDPRASVSAFVAAAGPLGPWMDGAARLP